MKSITTIFLALLVGLLIAQPAVAQEGSPNNFKSQFLGHFNYASRVLQLAKEMPEDTYDWRPMEDVSSVQEVYTHIARYNFMYLENALDIPAPEDINVDQIESITGKDEVVAILERSINHLQQAVEQMPESKLTASTELYGRTVNGQAVLMQLLTHLSEHVGQSIAYARMNEVVPPWNQ